MSTFKPHPAAELFPMMTEPELTELAADIKARGQLHPIIVTSENLVLDGRNRLAACEIAGVEPDVLMWDREDDDASPTAWVLSANMLRRHLNESQRALVAANALPLFEKEARRRKPGVPRGAPGRAADVAAETVGVGGRTVARAKAVLAKAKPDQIEAIKSGKATLKQVEKQLKHADQVRQAEVYVPPAGEFPVIVTDFPWKYDDELDGKGMERPLPYPSMTIAEICDFIDADLKPSESCALFCWVTNPILLDPKGWRIVETRLNLIWGFETKQIRTWVKTEADGSDFTGLGRVWRGDTEHLIRLERGRPIFNALGAEYGKPLQRTSFRAPIGKHSEKPAQAYLDIEALCPQPRKLELFARAPRAGWVTSGSELPAKKRKLQIADVTEAA